VGHAPVIGTARTSRRRVLTVSGLGLATAGASSLIAAVRAVVRATRGGRRPRRRRVRLGAVAAAAARTLCLRRRTDSGADGPDHARPMPAEPVSRFLRLPWVADLWRNGAVCLRWGAHLPTDRVVGVAPIRVS